MPQKLSNEKLKDQAQRHLRLSKRHLSSWRRETRQGYDFVAGRQYEGSEEADMKARGKVPVAFNRLNPMIRAAVGIEINNRQEVNFLPRTISATDQPPEDDRGPAETLTAATKWVREEAFAEFHDSAAHRDALICGLGLTEHSMDFSENPDGDVKIRRADPLEIYYDHTSRQFSLMDRQYDFRVRRFTVETFKAMFPGSEPGFDILGIGMDDPFEAEPHDQDNAGQYSVSNPSLGPEDEGRMPLVADYQFWRLEPVRRVVLTPFAQQALGLLKEGETPEERIETLEEPEFAKLSKDLELLGIPVADVEDGDADPMSVFYARTRKKFYYRAFLSGDTVLKHFRMPEGQFTRNYITGELDSGKGVFFGVVRPMKDPSAGPISSSPKSCLS